jgi:predicted HNH restriction endonuclease
MVVIIMKKCIKCEKEKTESEFNKDKNRKDKLACYCKTCSREMQRKWGLNPKNRECKNQKNSEWYYSNHEEINERRRKRRQELMKNEEYKKQQFKKRKEYEKNHRDQIKKCRQVYYKEHKKEINKKTIERKKSIVMENITKLGGKCVKCGYNKYYGALDIHHINPEEKENQEDRFKRNLDYNKLMLLCSNCHRELHGGVWR